MNYLNSSKHFHFHQALQDLVNSSPSLMAPDRGFLSRIGRCFVRQNFSSSRVFGKRAIISARYNYLVWSSNLRSSSVCSLIDLGFWCYISAMLAYHMCLRHYLCQFDLLAFWNPRSCLLGYLCVGGRHHAGQSSASSNFSFLAISGTHLDFFAYMKIPNRPFWV